MPTRATYRVLGERKGIVFLEDLKGKVSVTNDAEAVVEELHKTHPERRYVYSDTYGDLAELVHEGGIFMGFAPWRNGKDDHIENFKRIRKMCVDARANEERFLETGGRRRRVFEI